MLKYLLLILIGLVVWWAWHKRSVQSSAESGKPASRPPELMVACARCGVHLPKSESIAEQGQYFCCEAHRRAGPQSGAK